MTDGVKEAAASAEASLANTGQMAPPGFLALALGSVGVVYGDIGTSPLYAFREAAIAASDGHPVNHAIVLGVLSLIVWALLITVTAKYVLILLRADNNREGGTLSLTALASRALGRRTAFVFIVGVIGASMFLGDSVITPAISVLSAVEGLKLATPAFSEYVAPITVAILIGLFAAQRGGTAKVATLFGPIMVVWFVSIAIAGGLHIRDDPYVLTAIAVIEQKVDAVERSTPYSAIWKRNRRISCRAPRCSLPAIPNSRRPRCCTISSTTKCCTRTT